VIVNGLPLPRELLALIEAGRWRCPDDQSRLDQLFPDRGEFCCYSFGEMESETKGVFRDCIPMWHGQPDPSNPPGDIDPKRTVLIADLGIGYDQPIAIDYRLSLEQPRVLTLHWNRLDPPLPWEEIQSWKEGKRRYDEATSALLQWYCEGRQRGCWNRWVEIAPDFETFAKLVGL
jgi:hypothetical protein